MRDRHSSYDARIPHRGDLPLGRDTSCLANILSYHFPTDEGLSRGATPPKFNRPRNLPSLSNRHSSRVEYIATRRKQKTAAISTRHARRTLLAGCFSNHRI